MRGYPVIGKENVVGMVVVDKDLNQVTSLLFFTAANIQLAR